MTAILKITNGTDEISLINGPFFLANWRPGIPQYKDGGVYVGSPISDGRVIVYKRFANVVERMDIKHAALSQSDAAADIARLINLLEEASDYYINNESGNRVYLVARATNETSFRYAQIVSGSMPNLENPFASPFLQPGNQRVVQDNMVLILEHGHWFDAVPGVGAQRAVSTQNACHNLVPNGEFEFGPGSGTWWTERNSPTVTYTTEQADIGRYSAKIVGTSGSARGIWQDITDISSGTAYTITARAYVENGIGQLIAYDGGFFTNAVTDNTTNVTGWQDLTVTKTATAGGIRIFVNTQSAEGGAIFFDSIELCRYHGPGATTSLVEKPVSNFHGMTHITHAYTRDATGPTFSANLLDSALSYNLLPAGTAATDEVYFGSRVTTTFADEPTGGPFTSIAFNIESTAGNTGAELLTNTSFETNLTGWTDSAFMTATRVSAQAHAGTWSAKLDYPEVPISSADFTTTSFTTISSDTARFSGWIYFDAASNDSWSEGVLFIDWYDSGSSFVSRDSTDFDAKHVSWRYYEVLASKPPTATKVKVGVEFTEITPHGTITVYFDETSLVEPNENYTLVWKYYDGATWSNLDPVRDDTDQFQVAGENIVSWAIPQDWSITTVNSVQAFWVKAEVTALSGTFTEPTQQTYHPYFVSEPYIEVPSTSLVGDMRSLAKYLVKNKGGPFTQRIVYLINAGVDDVFADDGVGSLTTGGLTADMAQDASIGLRFTSVNIPQGAKISSARLWLIPEDASVTIEPAWIEIYGEADDNAPAYSTYANFSARTLTGAKVDKDMNGVAWPAADEHTINFADMSEIVQEIVDRSGWASGNALAIRITDNTFGATDTRSVHMSESISTAWQLEIEFLDNISYTTSVVMGSRKVSRGSDFNAYINMKPTQQPGIELTALGSTFSSTWPSTAGATPAPSLSALVFGNVFPELGAWRERVKIEIFSPLASDYAGRFRAYIRVAHQAEQASGSETRFRLKVSAGSGGAIATGEIALARYTQPELLDLGLVTIPVVGDFDSISFTIEASRTSSIQVTMFDFILIPADEWLGEFSNIGALLTGTLEEGSTLSIDSIGSVKKDIEALLLDTITQRARAAFVTASPPATLTQGETQRIWMLTVTNPELAAGGTDTVNVALINAVHSGRVFTTNRYLTPRAE